MLNLTDNSKDLCWTLRNLITIDFSICMNTEESIQISIISLIILVLWNFSNLIETKTNLFLWQMENTQEPKWDKWRTIWSLLHIQKCLFSKKCWIKLIKPRVKFGALQEWSLLPSFQSPSNSRWHNVSNIREIGHGLMHRTKFWKEKHLPILVLPRKT